jgi:hypothetical protein
MFVAAAAVALAVLSAMGTQAAEPQPAAPAAAALPISLDRIREALQRPRLHIPPPPESLATFRSGIEDQAPVFESVLEGMRRDLARWSGAGSVIHPPNTNSIAGPRHVGGVDVLPLISALKQQWSAAKTERTRREITEELAAFCQVNDCSVLEGGVSTSPEGVIAPPKPD